MNIFRSMYNVNVDTAIAYQKDTVTYHFLDNYDNKVKYNNNCQFERTEMMFGSDKMQNIYNSSVAVFGIGGVGGYVCEALARSGISTFYLYDPDVVSISNINRQIMATFKTIGKDTQLIFVKHSAFWTKLTISQMHDKKRFPVFFRYILKIGNIMV